MVHRECGVLGGLPVGDVRDTSPLDAERCSHMDSSIGNGMFPVRRVRDTSLVDAVGVLVMESSIGNGILPV